MRNDTIWANEGQISGHFETWKLGATYRCAQKITFSKIHVIVVDTIRRRYYVVTMCGDLCAEDFIKKFTKCPFWVTWRDHVIGRGHLLSRPISSKQTSLETGDIYLLQLSLITGNYSILRLSPRPAAHIAPSHCPINSTDYAVPRTRTYYYYYYYYYYCCYYY